MPAIELGIPYHFYDPILATNFTLNDPTAAGFVGYVTDITGLDSPGIRENAQVVIAGDGGYHGPFWKDRRPWTVSGIIMPVFPLLARDQAQEQLEGVIMNCLQGDGYLSWIPADGIQKMMRFRAQQPPRITKGQSNVQRNFQIACVTADWRALSWAQLSVSATLGAGALPLTLPTAQNLGNADASAKFVITGPLTGASYLDVLNTTTNKRIRVNSPSIAAGTTWTIDLTGYYPSVTDSAGGNHDGNVDPLSTDWSISVAGSLTWPALGNNVFQLIAPGATTSSATRLQVFWNHSWV